MKDFRIPFLFILMSAAVTWILSGCSSTPPKKTTTWVIDEGHAKKPAPTPPSASAKDSSQAAAKAASRGLHADAKADSVKRAQRPATASLHHAAGAPRQATPLIMENADRMEGSRSRGEFILIGKVRFTHGDLRLETERAVWQKDKNMVLCQSGMKITQKGAVLTADGGSYDKAQGQAVAEGNVRMRDSSGDVEAFGKTVVYNRQKHLTTLTGSPELRRYYPAKDSAAPDSTRPLPAAAVAAADSGKARPAGSVAKPAGDTLVIRGRAMTYDDSQQVAVAEGNVHITRDKMRIDCARAEYHDKADSLYLLGEPQVQVDDSKVKGQTMRLGMHGEEIRSLLVKGAAQAHSLEPATDSSVARQSHVEGDSLFLAFKEKAIDSVQVFRHANGSYFDVDKPEYVNKMSGEYMVLRFAGRQIRSANVLGGAKSTYYHIETKKLKGRNEAEGDTIDFAFKEGKIDEVMVRGSAKGHYFGEGGKAGRSIAPDTLKPKPGAKPDAVSADTARAAVKAPAMLKPEAKPAEKPAAAPTPAAPPKKQSVIRPWGGK
jgi:lipopolysaccharide export system protein LptA